MKRFQTLIFVLAAVGIALVGMLVAGILIGTDPHTEAPARPVSSAHAGDRPSR